MEKDSFVWAADSEGNISKCFADEENRGKGRCNHVFHQNEGESLQDFSDRVSVKVLNIRRIIMSENIKNLSKNLKDRIERFMNESYGLISGNSCVDFNDIDFLISESEDGQISLEYNRRLWQMAAIKESGKEYEEVTVRLIKKFKNEEEFLEFINSDGIIEISSISIDQMTH